MNRIARFAIAGAFVLAGGQAALAAGKTIGVSWSNFQEERWKTDEAAMKAAIEKAGGTYVSADAQSQPSKQLSDVESLITRGVNALIILAQDSDAIRPAVEKAAAEGIPVVGYDRLIEIPSAFYITFDNKEVGRMQAQGVFKVKPKGNYAFIKGSSADPNADFLFAGQMEVLKPAIGKGDIKNVGEAYTDGWLPSNAQKNMEQILTKNNNKVDAVVASNDGTAGGAIAALAAPGPCRIGAGFGPRRRQGGAQPHRARHADCFGMERRARAGTAGGGNCHRSGRRQKDDRDQGRDRLRPGTEEGEDELGAAHPRADHEGQSECRDRRRLGDQGHGLPGCEARLRQGLQLTGPLRAGGAAFGESSPVSARGMIPLLKRQMAAA